MDEVQRSDRMTFRFRLGAGLVVAAVVAVTPFALKAEQAAPQKVYADGTAWAIGTPDLIVKMKEVTVKGNAPDWWGEVPSVPTGLTEDRYVAALEIKEVNDVERNSGQNRATVGGRFVVHHMIWRTQVIDPNNENQPPDQLSFLLDEEPVNWPV